MPHRVVEPGDAFTALVVASPVQNLRQTDHQ